MRVSERLVRWSCVVPAAAAVVGYTAFLVRHAVNTIYWDYWASVPLVHALDDGRLTWSQVWEQAANNRTVLPRVIALALGQWFRLDVRYELALGWVFLAIAVALIVVTQRRIDGGPLYVYAPAAFFLFSAVQWQSALWNVQMARFLILVLFAFAMFVVCRFTGWAALAVAAIASVAAATSLVDGFLLWPAIGLLLWCDGRPSRGPRLAAWFSIGAVTAVRYFIGFDFGGNSGDVGYVLAHPVASAEYVLTLLGGFSRASSGAPGVALGCGILMLGLAVWVVARFVLSERGLAEALPVALVVFVFLFDLSTLIGRGSAGSSQALASRYTTYNLLVFVAAYFALVNRHPTRISDELRTPLLALVGGVGLALSCLLATVSWTTARHEGADFAAELRMSARVLRHYRSAPEAEIERYVCPALCGDLVPREAPFLERRGYSVFAD